MKCADRLIAQNAKDYEHKVPKQADANPLLERHWYVHGGGVKRTFSQREEKEMAGTAPVSSKKALQDAGAFMEGLGAPSGASGSGDPKIENVVYTEMNISAEKLRILHLLLIRRNISINPR